MGNLLIYSAAEIFCIRPRVLPLPAISRIARAQAYPARPVRIIVSSAAGSAMGVHGRLHGQIARTP